MRSYILVFLCLLIFTAIIPEAGAQQGQSDDYYQENFIRNSDYIYKDNIKTVLVYKDGYEMDEPVLLLNSDDRLVLRFDDLNGDYQKYEYTVIHCDADWNESDLMPNEYLDSFSDDYIEEFQYGVNTIQAYTHYWKTLPNDVISWRLSGNYLLKVYQNNDQNDVLFTRRFYVVDPRVSVMASVKKPANISDRDSRQEVRFSIQTAGLNVNDPYREIDVTIRQNGRWDNAITDLQPRLISLSVVSITFLVMNLDRLLAAPFLRLLEWLLLELDVIQNGSSPKLVEMREEMDSLT